MPDADRSTTPQLENGYTKLADELLEAICRAHLGGREVAVLLALVRLTYGWGKKRDRIAASQLSKLTNIPRPKIPAILRSLETKKIIRIDRRGQGRIPTLSILKDHRKWPKRAKPKPEPKRGASSRAPQPAPVLGSTCSQNGGVTSPLQGAHHKQRDTSRERDIRFGRLKPRLTKKKVATLIAIRPGGALYTEDEVQAWFLATEPVMIAKGYTSTVRCAVNWFRRVKPDEIRKAVGWVESQAMEELKGQDDDREKDSIEDFAEAFGL